MKIAIVGAGSLGQTYAALVAGGKRAVTLVATPRTASELLTLGRIQLADSCDRSVPVSSDPNPPAGTIAITKNLAKADSTLGIVFTTKAHQLKPAISTLGVPLRAVSWVAGVQNGIAKDDVLAEAFGGARVVGASTIVGAERVSNGHVRVTALGATYFGELKGGSSKRVQQIVETFAHCRIPAQAVDDIRGLLWAKACNATGAFGVSVLTGPNAPLIGYDRDLMRAFLTLARETAAVARASGVEIQNFEGLPPLRSYVDRPIDELLGQLPEPPPQGAPRSYPSMLQDYLAGRPMEVEEVFADIVARGEQRGVPVPCLTFVRDLLRGLERRSVGVGTQRPS